MTPEIKTSEAPTSWKDLADGIYNRELETAPTIGAARLNLQRLLEKYGEEHEIGQRLSDIDEGLGRVAEGGNEGIRLKDDLGAGVLGQNRVGTKESDMRRDQLSAEQVVQHTREVVDTALHENSEEVGHAGQDSTARVDIIKDGKHVQSTVLFEGNVVTKVSRKLGGRREGLPQQTYGEGADLVQELGVDTVDKYMRKGREKVGEALQVEVWKKQKGNLTYEQLLEEGAQVGMSSEEVQRAAQELDIQPEPEVAMAA